ncbi:hypothetical protein H5T51_00160 [Candidatus Bathyarchaeota archaeon]|nr:hypothetical protein [Candidatus Bathyarchaeota archaeon]
MKRVERGAKKRYRCINCSRLISEEEYNTYHGYCQECYETEIAEIDFEEE